MKVLLVDDDTVLRKMLSRSMKRVAPSWNIREAANGETALSLVQQESFDLIFVDQYMASINRQLLGTESVQAMRSTGVESCICGLSANNLHDAFSIAGADYFLTKPFSTNKEALQDDLARILGLHKH